MGQLMMLYHYNSVKLLIKYCKCLLVQTVARHNHRHRFYIHHPLHQSLWLLRYDIIHTFVSCHYHHHHHHHHHHLFLVFVPRRLLCTLCQGMGHSFDQNAAGAVKNFLINDLGFRGPN